MSESRAQKRVKVGWFSASQGLRPGLKRCRPSGLERALGWALLLASAPGVMLAEVSPTVEVDQVRDRTAVVCFAGTAATTDSRVAYATPAAIWSGFSGVTGAGLRCVMLTDLAPSMTYDVRPELRTAGGWDSTYNCTVGALDAIPEGGAGTAACVGGVLQITTAAAATETGSGCDTAEFGTCDEWTPNAPVMTLPSMSAMTATSRSWTVASCTQAAVDAALQSCRTDATDDAGDYDRVIVSNGCDIELELADWFTSANPDQCRMESDRTGTRYCPADGQPVSPLDDDDCLYTLRVTNKDVNGMFRLSSSGPAGVIFKHARLSFPDENSANRTEGGLVTAATVSGADLDLTVTAHGIVSPGDPDRVYIGRCKDGGGNWSGLNGGWAYSVPDVDTIRVTGAAAFAGAAGCLVTQEETPFQTIIYNDSNAFLGFDQVVFDQNWPNRAARLVLLDNTADNVEILNSYVRYGNWEGLVGTAVDVGAVYGNNPDNNTLTPPFLSFGGTSQVRVRGMLVEGGGLATLFTDVFDGQSSNVTAETIWAFMPEYRLDMEPGNGSDGHAGFVYACRSGGGYEFKLIDHASTIGWMVSGYANCPSSQGTPMWPFYVRANLSGSDLPTRGTSDFFARTLVSHRTPHTVRVEGLRNDATYTARAEGRIWFSNVLANRMDERLETGYDTGITAVTQAGTLLGVGHNVPKLTFERFTDYKADDHNGAFRATFAQITARVRNGILAPVARTSEAHTIWTSQGDGGTNQAPDPDNAEAADWWRRIARHAGGGGLFDDMTLVPGCETRACDMDVEATTGQISDVELTNEIQGTDGYNFTTTTIVGGGDANTISQDVALLNLTARFDHPGGKGYDPDVGDADLRIIRPAAGNTQPVKAVCSGSTGITWQYHTPRAMTCMVRYRPLGDTAEPQEAIKAAAGAQDDVITVNGLTPGVRYRWVFSCSDSPAPFFGVGKGC